MIMYKAVFRFADLQDNWYIYEVGDSYPREGYEPTPERIAELAGTKNKVGKVLIERVKKAEKKAEDVAEKTPRKKK